MKNFWLLEERRLLGFKIPWERKVFIYGTSNQNWCFPLHFAVQSGRDLPDLGLF